jgi:uncharacterized protein (TIGR00369 family)
VGAEQVPASRAKTPDWYAHPSGALFTRETLSLSGIEILRAMMERRLPDPPLSKLTDIRITDVGLGAATMAMPAIGWWQSAAGVFPAGVLAFLADGALGSAVMTAAPPQVGMMTTEIAMNFVRPATIRSGWMIGRGRVIHSTRAQALAEAFIEDSRGRLLAHGTSRGLLVPIDIERIPAAQQVDTTADWDVSPHKLEPSGDVFGQDYFNSRSGLDVMRDFVEGRYVSPVNAFTGARVTDYGDGEATFTLPTTGWLTNAYGVFYGGAIALMADFALNCAVWTRLPKATSFAPLDLKINYLRPVFPNTGELVARSHVVHMGKTIAVASCEIFDPSGKPAAMAVETILILPSRPWERPVYVGDEVPVERAGAS